VAGEEVSWVYFLRRDDGDIKIGYSANVRVRVANIRAAELGESIQALVVRVLEKEVRRG
jgi:predicted GIY-YIG superfamily endonuclease